MQALHNKDLRVFFQRKKFHSLPVWAWSGSMFSLKKIIELGMLKFSSYSLSTSHSTCHKFSHCEHSVSRSLIHNPTQKPLSKERRVGALHSFLGIFEFFELRVEYTWFFFLSFPSFYSCLNIFPFCQIGGRKCSPYNGFREENRKVEIYIYIIKIIWFLIRWGLDADGIVFLPRPLSGMVKW